MSNSRIVSLSVILMFLSMLPLLAQADTYRYRDTNGMVHYTDHQHFTVKPLPTSGRERRFNRDGVLVRVAKKPDGHYFFALNRLMVTVDINLHFSKRHNVHIPQPIQQTLILPASKEVFIGKLSAQETAEWHYQHSFTYHSSADPSSVELSTSGTQAKVDANLITLPEHYVSSNTTAAYFETGPNLASPIAGRYRISQGFNGEFSHNLPANRYALDIALPIGTALHATRDGVVMAAVDSHVGGGLAAQYRGKANHLRLRHADGTMTLYAHLQTGSLRVRKGDRVKVGQRVAASGNTGYSSGPHLHLALQIINAGRKESIPFTLQGTSPLAGLWLSGRAMGTE